mmetsp:Transcript_20850/g.43668  ORF Transcript_20850/g.43668 Transcript_20850/m.43668 type:complete len:240 (+) Transcript_20850:1500-2219(+)
MVIGIRLGDDASEWLSRSSRRIVYVSLSTRSPPMVCPLLSLVHRLGIPGLKLTVGGHFIEAHRGELLLLRLLFHDELVQHIRTRQTEVFEFLQQELWRKLPDRRCFPLGNGCPLVRYGFSHCCSCTRRKAWLGKHETVAVAIGAVIDPVVFGIAGVRHEDPPGGQEQRDRNVASEGSPGQCDAVVVSGIRIGTRIIGHCILLVEIRIDRIELLACSKKLHNVAELPRAGNVTGALGGAF